MEKSTAKFYLPFVLLIIIHSCFGNTRHDDTLTDRAAGRDVVESVIRKIQKSNIFKPDHSFLIRLAFVESKFGTDSKTFRSGYYGGIWQIDESVFKLTQSNSADLSQIYSAIDKNFNIQWTDVTWEQLLKPMYSGFAAAIYLSTLSTPIPDKLDQQANHWIQFFRKAESKTKFKTDSAELQKDTICRGKMDLVIVLDSSGSIGASHYKTALEFVSSLISSFTLDHTRIGMLIYSTNVQVIFPLGNKLSIGEMADLATKATYMYEGTNTHLGILEAVNMFAEAGSIDGIPKVMIVFTDGDSNDKSATKLAVSQSASVGITSMSVGIGSDISDEELVAIARGDMQHMFQLSDFSALQDFIFTLTEVACEVPQVTDIDQKYTDSLVKDEKRLYTVKLPKEGLTVHVDVSEGDVESYWSKYEDIPSKAVHDGKIDGPTFIPGEKEIKRVKRSISSDLGSSTSTVYISIKGVGEMNNYTFSTDVGNTAEIFSNPESKSNSVAAVPKFLIATLVVFFVIN